MLLIHERASLVAGCGNNRNGNGVERFVGVELAKKMKSLKIMAGVWINGGGGNVDARAEEFTDAGSTKGEFHRLLAEREETWTRGEGRSLVDRTE